MSSSRHAVDWNIKRLGNVERNLLRMALFELLYLRIFQWESPSTKL
jgi:transcription termination factor NusB